MKSGEVDKGAASEIALHERSPRDADWPRRYASRLFYSDAGVIALTFAVYSLITLDELSEPVSWEGDFTLPYWALLTFVSVWAEWIQSFITSNTPLPFAFGSAATATAL